LKVTELQKALRIIENFEHSTSLSVNRQKSEILELGVTSSTCDIPVREIIKIAGLNFCLDKQKMLNTNWESVVDRIKVLTRSWQQRYLTEIGRANIIKAHILPLITFVGTTLSLQVRIQKQVETIIHHFL
jgi:hypothetical protein